MRNDDICYMTATEALALFRRRKLSPVELVKALVARAEKVNPAINCLADRYFDDALVQVFCQAGGGYHLLERIVERLQVGVELFAQVAGQEAEVLARFHRRAREDDAAHLAFLERLHGEGHGGVGLAGTGGADGEDHVACLNGLHQLLLVGGAGLHTQACIAVHEHIGLFTCFAAFGAAHDVVEHLAGQLVVAGHMCHELIEPLLEADDLAGGSGGLHRIAPGHQVELGEEAADQAQVAVVGSQDLQGFHPGDGDQLLDQDNIALFRSSPPKAAGSR